MGFEIDRFLELRPCVYHVTDRANLPMLRAGIPLRTAAELLAAADREDLLRVRRKESVALPVEGGTVVLKDQGPLIAPNVALADGWSFGDHVEFLNRHVYFWPGTADGPIRQGRRLLDHYEAEGPVVLRIPTADLLRANPRRVPVFSPFNSGAPRHNGGHPAGRGPDLFTDASRFPRSAGKVVEMAFRGAVHLPLTTQMRTLAGWTSLTPGRA